MSSPIDTAIVGAGPYGLSLAAHLRGKGVTFRTFGRSMDLWRSRMPEGMFLKSQGFASNLSDPAGSHTLERFCRATGRTYANYGVPVPLDTFIAYGEWFQKELVPDLEERLVTKLTRTNGYFELVLDSGEAVKARTAVLATGVEHFAYVPEQFASLGKACTHTSEHTDLSVFRGRDVTVVGGGQSALESAALLHEHGAVVRVVVRENHLAWNGEPLPLERPLVQRLREPEAGLGSGWSTWFYSTQPRLFTLLPDAKRIEIARTALGPAGACWLRSRVDGQFPVLLGTRIAKAEVVRGRGGGRVRLQLRGSDGSSAELTTDHLMCATGFRSDLRRLSFVDPALLARVRTIATAPRVDRSFQTSVPGLYIMGPAVASTFGPVMRFVYGADFAASQVAARLVSRPTGIPWPRRPITTRVAARGTPARRSHDAVGADR